MIADPSDFWGPYTASQYLIDEKGMMWAYEGFGSYYSLIKQQFDYTCSVCGHVCEEDEIIMEWGEWYGEDGGLYCVIRCFGCGHIFEVVE